MIALYILLPALCLGVCLPMFFRERGKRRGLSLMWKALGTCCALGLALTGAIPAGGASWLCAGALLLCAAADVLLDLNFLIGMGVFLAGHLCYIAWYLRLVPADALHLALVGLLSVAAAATLSHFAPLMRGKRIPFGVYAAVLCVMGGFGLAAGLTLATSAGWLIAGGALLFVVSDGMVCKEVLSPVSRAFDWTAMTVYYAGQLMLGLGCALL